MTFVILAAGKGIRANLDSIPKVLLKDTDGKSIIINTLEKVLSVADNNYVNLVIGYQYKKIIEEVNNSFSERQLKNINFIYNKDYEKGVITSLYCGLKNLDDELVIMNGDTHYSVDVFRIINQLATSTLIVMPKKELSDSVNVVINGEEIIQVGKNLVKYSYISTGCLYLNSNQTKLVKPILKDTLTNNDYGKMIWHQVINLLVDIGEKITFKVVGPNHIHEIDTQQDYMSFINFYEKNIQ